MVFNTPFNRDGLPPVCTPDQAIQLLLLGCVDGLVLNDIYIEKKFDAHSPEPSLKSEAEILENLKPHIFTCVDDPTLTASEKRDLIRRTYPHLETEKLKAALPDQGKINRKNVDDLINLARGTRTS